MSTIFLATPTTDDTRVLYMEFCNRRIVIIITNLPSHRIFYLIFKKNEI